MASKDFASQLSKITQVGASTQLGSAIRLATEGIFNNSFEGEGIVAIDISTDGRPNGLINAANAASEALDKGIGVINAIAVGNNADVDYLENNIIGGKNLDGSDAFVKKADSFADFEAILADKIFQEVGGGVIDPPTEPVDPPTEPVEPPTEPIDPPPSPVDPMPPSQDIPEPVSVIAIGIFSLLSLSSLSRKKCEVA